MTAAISNPARLMLQSAYKHLTRNGYMPDWAAYSIQEASEKTGYNPEYLRRLVRTGKLEHTKIGRVILIRVSSLNAYIAEMDALNNNRTGPRK